MFIKNLMKRSRLSVMLFALAFGLVFVSYANAIELKVLHYFDITSPEAKVEGDIMAAFEAAHPEIKLRVEKLFGEAYHQKLRALAAAGILPDVMYLWPGGRSTALTENDLVADLYPYLGKDIDNYVPAAVAPQGKGCLYELPIGITATHVIYVNTKILSGLGLAMPQTYDELVSMVPTITAAGLDPIIMANKAAWVMQSCLFSALVGRIGGTEWLEKAIAGKASFTDKEFVSALEIVKNLYDTGLLPSSSIQLEYGDGPNLFTQGKGVFMIDGDWRTGALTPLLTADQQSDIELTVFPKIKGEKGPSSSTSVVPATGFGMKVGLPQEKAEAAWKWISFYAGPEAARIRLVQQGIPPSYKIDISDIELEVLAKKRVNFYAPHPGTPVLDNVISGEPIEVINIGLQKLALGDITPEKLAKEVEAAFGR